MKLPILAGVWLLACGAGLAAMNSYETSPSAPAAPPEKWPVTSRLHPARVTLVMFAHPFCPCTRASIGELAKVMARCQGKVSAHVLFLQPTGEAVEWSHTDLWRSAKEIPGVEVQADLDGAEAHRFNIAGSGQSALYVDGRLRFAGGVTGSRGHAGDNASEDAVLAILRTGQGGFASAPSYGCPLSSSCP